MYDLILKNTAKYISLTSEEENFYLSLLEYKKLKRREFLLVNGAICQHENYVIKGCLKNFSVDSNGFESIGMFAIEDWWTGDMFSFLTQTPSNINIVAMEDTEVFQLSKENQEKLLEQIPKFEKCYRIKYQNSFISLQKRMIMNLSATAEERYLDFISRYPWVEKRIPLKYIAAYLGITPEFLSMIRRKLAKG